MATADCLGTDTDQLLRSERDATPLFRTDGGPEEAEGAVAQFAAVIDGFLNLRGCRPALTWRGIRTCTRRLPPRAGRVA